ncbi:hypothetical protein [Rhodococcus koreensis]|uniref:hypothetical protein n=1 Tax=Rhodococcus koreensis TaxID=99653 RepID=UPI0036709DB1
MWAMGIAADALTHLRAAKLPVKAVWAPEGAAVHWFLVVVPEDWRDMLPGVSSEEFAKQVGEVLFETDAMLFIPKVFLVDDDIDPANLSDVVWAISTRVHPTGRRAVSEDQRIVRLPQCYEEGEYASGRGPKIVYDTLQPAFGEGRNLHSSFEQGYPEELEQRVLAHWPA